MKTNRFVHRISKEEVQTLPVASFGGEIIVVQTAEACHKAIQYLSTQSVVGVDTETRPSFTHGQHYPTALVQIASTERCYLFQLKALGGLPDELAALFANADICKVGLAFTDDLHGLQRLHKFNPKNCKDLQKMVGQYGILDLGLQKMFAIVFGKKISKAQQLSNWENETLTAEQVKYAATDAWATLLIYNELLQTKPLTKKLAEIIRLDDLEKQQEHQREVLEARKINNNNGNE